jgi:hypothetical protein
MIIYKSKMLFWGAGGGAQVVESLLSKDKALSSIAYNTIKIFLLLKIEPRDSLVGWFSVFELRSYPG